MDHPGTRHRAPPWGNGSSSGSPFRANPGREALTPRWGSPRPTGGPATPRPGALPAAEAVPRVSAAGPGRQRAGPRVQTPHPAQPPPAVFGEPRHAASAGGTPACSAPEPGAGETTKAGAGGTTTPGVQRQWGTRAAMPPQRRGTWRGGLTAGLVTRGAGSVAPRGTSLAMQPLFASPARHLPAARQLLRQQGAEAATLAPQGAGTFHLPSLMWWEGGGGKERKRLVIKEMAPRRKLQLTPCGTRGWDASVPRAGCPTASGHRCSPRPHRGCAGGARDRRKRVPPGIGPGLCAHGSDTGRHLPLCQGKPCPGVPGRCNPPLPLRHPALRHTQPPGPKAGAH